MDESIPATKFKSHVLALLDRVARTGETIVVTKRGKPVAELRPLAPSRKRKSLAGSVKTIGDVVSPLGDVWNAEK